MKTINTLLLIMSVIVTLNVNSQTLTQKEQLRENNEVELLTHKERSEIQMWFHQEVQKMNMTAEKFNEYESNLLVYTSKMMRLNDLDKDFTLDEINNKFDALLLELNFKMNEILNEKEYEIHEQNFKFLSNFIKLRLEVILSSESK